MVFAWGFGILFHDYLHGMWLLGGYKELLSFQGGYLGAILMLIGWIIGTYLSDKDIEDTLLQYGVEIKHD